MAIRVSRHYAINLGYTWQSAQAEAYYNALITANGGIDIDTVNLYSLTLNNFKQAIDSFFVTGTTDGWINKIAALYLYIGGTAATHSINAVNPGTFDLTFYGSPTYSAAGTQFNGTTQYAMTGFIPSVHLTSLVSFFGFNSRTNTPNVSISKVMIGSQNSTLSRCVCYKSPSTYKVRYDCWTSSQTVSSTTINTDNDFLCVRNYGTISIYTNGNLDNQAVVSGGTLSTKELSIAALNNNDTISFFSDNLFTYHVIGNDDLSSYVSSFYNARNLLDITLGR